MWFQTLKARQGIRHFTTANSKGQAAAIEYNDKKVEVHLIKTEATPLLLDEGSHVAFLVHKTSAISLLSLSLSLKNGKVQLECRVWDMMGALGVTPKDILIEDMNNCYVNDGKFKGVVTLPEQHCSSSSSIRIDSCREHVAVALDISLVLLWRGRKVDLNTITFTLEGVIRSQMAVHSLCLIPDPNDKQGGVQVLIGEASGVRVWNAVKEDQDEGVMKVEQWTSSFVSLPHVDPGGSSAIQGIKRYSCTRCILSDTTGRLWELDLSTSVITELQLPSSPSGHEVFAVQDNVDGNGSELLVVVEKGNTLNLFDLKTRESTSSTLVPYHSIFSFTTVTSIAFLQPNVLAAGSTAHKSFMMWVGLNMAPS